MFMTCLQAPHVPSALQKGRSVDFAAHSPSLPQRRQTLGLTARLQIGAVGVLQFPSVAHPPQAPLAVQRVFPVQLFGDVLHASHVSVDPLQIGVLPLQPELSVGLHAAQRPAMHSVLPSLRSAQAVLSAHSAQALNPEPLATQ
jgi:hypothetical protein